MRMVRLLTVVFVLILSVTALSAAPRSSGSFRLGKSKLHASMTQADWYYYCYRDGIVKPCGGYADCMSACLEDCGPPCTYEGEAIN